MGAVASQITSLTIAYSTVYSGADQRKLQNSASLAFAWGIHRWIILQMASNAENVSIWWRHHAIFCGRYADCRYGMPDGSYPVSIKLFFRNVNTTTFDRNLLFFLSLQVRNWHLTLLKCSEYYTPQRTSAEGSELLAIPNRWYGSFVVTLGYVIFRMRISRARY